MLSGTASPAATPLFFPVNPPLRTSTSQQHSRWGRHSVAVASVVCILLLGAAMSNGSTAAERFVGNPLAAPRFAHTPMVAEPQRRRTWRPHLRVERDDVIDVQAEVVDVEDRKNPKGTGKPPQPQQDRPGDSSFRHSSDDQETATVVDPQMSQAPWWLPTALSILPHLVLGIMGGVAIACMMSGVFQLLLTFLGGLVLTNVVLNFFKGGDLDEDEFPEDSPGGGHRRSPWA